MISKIRIKTKLYFYVNHGIYHDNAGCFSVLIHLNMFISYSPKRKAFVLKRRDFDEGMDFSCFKRYDLLMSGDTQKMIISEKNV